MIICIGLGLFLVIVLDLLSEEFRITMAEYEALRGIGMLFTGIGTGILIIMLKMESLLKKEKKLSSQNTKDGM